MPRMRVRERFRAWTTDPDASPRWIEEGTIVEALTPDREEWQRFQVPEEVEQGAFETWESTWHSNTEPVTDRSSRA